MEADTTTITSTTASPINSDYSWLTLLASWLSPAYPVGAYCYSHGIEWAVEAGVIKNVRDLTDYIATVLEAGAGWSDLVLAAESYRAAAGGQTDAMDDIVEIALALRPSHELALESLQQGSAFVSVTRGAWPGTALDLLAQKHPGGIPYSVAAGTACAGRVPLPAMLLSLCHAIAGNLMSAGVRLIPLGQTDGQRTLAALSSVMAAVAARAEEATLVDIGSAAPGIELFSVRHETQYTRLFRS